MMQKLLVEAIVRLKDESGITVALSEQFARPVLPIIDYGYVIENGMLSLTGTGEELMDNSEVKAAYFGV
jgi:branched-chain amino acid transport system ATP-binding protein